MAPRLRIAHIVGNLETGGMQAIVIELMRRLDRERFNPVLVYFREPNHFQEEIANRQWECHHVPLSRYYKRRDLWRLARFLDRERFDLVHTHSHFANFAGRAAAAAASRAPRIVAHYQNTYEHRLDARFRSMEEFLAPATDTIVACSQGVEEFLARHFKLGDVPVVLLPNCVDLEPYEAARQRREEIRAARGVAKEIFHIVHTARLEHHKRPDRLIDALHLSRLDPERSLGDWRLSFVGRGSWEEKLRKHIARLDDEAAAAGHAPLAPRIEFVGWSREIPEWLASGDVFTLVSENEGLPLSLIEAMAAGTPAVCSDIVGPHEVIQNGANGLLVDSSKPEEVLAALLKLRRDEEARRSIIEGGIIRARDYSITRFMQKMEELYDHLSSHPRRHRPMSLLGRMFYLNKFCGMARSGSGEHA